VEWKRETSVVVSLITLKKRTKTNMENLTPTIQRLELLAKTKAVVLREIWRHAGGLDFESVSHKSLFHRMMGFTASYEIHYVHEIIHGAVSRLTDKMLKTHEFKARL